jgi:hypothetical protein
VLLYLTFVKQAAKDTILFTASSRRRIQHMQMKEKRYWSVKNKTAAETFCFPTTV